MFQSTKSPLVSASASRLQRRVAPETSPQTRLKSLTQSVYSAGLHFLQSAIILCHPRSHFSGPVLGHSTNFAVIINRCFDLVISFICVSDGFVASFMFEIHSRMDSSAGSRTCFSSGIVVRSFVRNFAFSFK